MSIATTTDNTSIRPQDIAHYPLVNPAQHVRYPNYLQFTMSVSTLTTKCWTKTRNSPAIILNLEQETRYVCQTLRIYKVWLCQAFGISIPVQTICHVPADASP